jgi:hypothetical protein
MAIKPGQQLSMSAPAPKTEQQAAPEQKGEGKKEEKKEEGKEKPDKPGEKPAPKEDKAPPPPEMKIEPLKAETFANIPNFTPPPMAPPPPPPGPPPQKADALDAIMQKIEETVRKEQIEVSPSGG